MGVDEIVDDVLEHHGTKGMKWGVRRADKKFEKQISNSGKNVRLKIKLHNSVHTATNEHIDRINKKYQKAIDDGTLLKAEHPTTKKYHQEVMDAYVSELNKAASGMTNRSGTRQYSVHQNDYDFLGFTVTAKDVKHADNSNSFRVDFIKDDKGRIIGFKLADGTMTQSSESFVQTFLEHHGVKGMKWGIRRKATVGPQEVIISDRRKKLKTSGGEGHPAHPDAVRARTVGQIGKKSGLKALSDKELQDYSKRLQLEANVKRLNYNEMNMGKKFVANLLGQTGKGAAQNVANDVAGAAVKKHLTSRILKGAALAAA